MIVTSRERVLAAVRGAVLDRPPFALWRHFYDVEGSPAPTRRRAQEGARGHDADGGGAPPLAEAMVGWARRYRFDLLKYNPRARYHLEPFGAELPTRAATPDHPTFSEMLEGLRHSRAALSDLPILMTIFTPLAVCAYFFDRDRERFGRALREEGGRIEAALDVIAETLAAFARRCLEAGADGIFYATLPIASRDWVSDEQWARFGRPYDVRVLDAVAGAPLNVLHVCGDRTRVLDLADYPHVAALSWNVHGAGNPSLREVRDAGRAVVGGLSDEALLREDEGLVWEQVSRGFAETGGRGWIVAGGCTIPPDSSDRAIRAARDALAHAQGSGANAR